MPSALLLFVLACAPAPGGEPARTPPPGDDTQAAGDSAPPEGDSATPTMRDLTVTVTLDGAPLPGMPVQQIGTELQVETDESGRATLPIDVTVEAPAVAVSHPEARIAGRELYDSDFEGGVSIELERFDTGDNLLYVFQDPGEPDRRESTTYCSHCHVTIVTDWYDSAHRQAASNPVVQDVYAGVAAAWLDADTCADNGGSWRTGLGPGTGAPADRCYTGAGTLPDLNPDCAETTCDGVAAETGACADCHAPGIDGQLGGRDLLEAEGFAYDFGVHCDVCHKVESVDVTHPDPGVAGKLRILRPTEEGTTAGPWQPLTFGPYPDVLNPRMGSVQRDHFKEPTLCAGCHEHHQPALVPDTAVDPARWPDGLLPVHTTYSELADGPLGTSVPCQSCHMPPDPDVGNSADLDNLFDVGEGVAGGWRRHPGAVRRHVWFGPRHPEQRMLELAASLQVQSRVEDGVFVVETTATNSGPGHAIPTGEPLRHLLLAVEARCGDTRLTPTEGPVLPDYAGAVALRAAGADWTTWPEAEAGMRIRVVRRTGAWDDYTGYGPFGDGTFSAEQKGLPIEVLSGEADILSVTAEGLVALSTPLPEGDLAYLVRPSDALPAEGDAWSDLAGAPGTAFARVMTDAAGQRMVPHHAAVDVVSDNRLLPTQARTITHRFPASCEAPTAAAVLLHRPYPLALAAERGWVATEAVMAEVR